MSDIELKERILAIMDMQSKKDGRLRTAWTGNVESIWSVEIKPIRLMTLSAEYRRRESRRGKRCPAHEPWSPKAEPRSIDKWAYFPDWLIGHDLNQWKDADEFWEKCLDCDGSGDIECVWCDGSGEKRCNHCAGTGMTD